MRGGPSPPPPPAPPRQIVAADTAYVASYPELPALLAEFTTAVLREKPAGDLRAFARDYFSRER